MKISEKDKVSYKVAGEFLDSLNLSKVRFLDYSFGKGITYTYGSFEVSIYISMDNSFHACIKCGNHFLGEFCPLFNPIENENKFLSEFILFMQSAYSYDFSNRKKIKTVHIKKITKKLNPKNGSKFSSASKHVYIYKSKLKEVEKKYWN